MFKKSFSSSSLLSILFSIFFCTSSIDFNAISVPVNIFDNNNNNNNNINGPTSWIVNDETNIRQQSTVSPPGNSIVVDPFEVLEQFQKVNETLLQMVIANENAHNKHDQTKNIQRINNPFFATSTLVAGFLLEVYFSVLKWNSLTPVIYFAQIYDDAMNNNTTVVQFNRVGWFN